MLKVSGDEVKEGRDSYINVVTSRYGLAERNDRLEGRNECCPIDADRYLASPWQAPVGASRSYYHELVWLVSCLSRNHQACSLS